MDHGRRREASCRPAGVLACALVTMLARPALSSPGDEPSAGGFGFGLALGGQLAPGLACRVEAHAACSGSTLGWAARAQVEYAMGTRWTAGLTLGFGTDLDRLESTTPEAGHLEDGRQFVDLLARVRHPLGESGRGWVGLEAGLAVARDWMASYDAVDRRTARASARQHGPALGALAGFRLAGNQRLAVEAELGARVTSWGTAPPPLLGDALPGADGAFATAYGRPVFLWVGLGVRYAQ